MKRPEEMRPDTTRLAGNLWIGGRPAPGTQGFDVIVFVADQDLPEHQDFPGVKLELFPFDDAEKLQRHEMQNAVRAARSVATHVRKGRRVLVACRMGRNRSAFVCGLALHILTGKSGLECAEFVRERRRDRLGVQALSNEAFFNALAGLKPKGAAFAPILP